MTRDKTRTMLLAHKHWDGWHIDCVLCLLGDIERMVGAVDEEREGEDGDE